MTRPWRPGAVTGIGSLPGTRPDEAAALVFGELPELPHLPELPARGAGADMIGRSAALLVDLPVELVPSGWRLSAHDGADVRRARDFLARDLDAFEAHGAGYAGALKAQAAGPLTLAAGVELPSGHAIVSDHGALRDLTDSLAEGLAAHLAGLRTRVPGARPVLQLDEPSLPAVLAGALPTASGYGTVRAVERSVAEQALRTVLAAAPEGGRVVHCCAADVPLGLLVAAGADAVTVDAELIGPSQYDALGEVVDAGIGLWLGIVPATDAAGTLDAARARLERLWRELGFSPGALAAAVVPTPACGLAGASAAQVRHVLSVLRDLGRDLLERAD